MLQPTVRATSYGKLTRMWHRARMCSNTSQITGKLPSVAYVIKAELTSNHLQQ